MDNNNRKKLRDFLYLDLPKLGSIYSQLTGGLVTGTELHEGSEKDQRNIRKYDLKVFKPEFGGVDKQVSSYTEQRVMHHDLANEVERLLFEEKYAVDLNKKFDSESILKESTHELLRNSYYVKAHGWVLIEDYERIKFVAGNYNEIMTFVNKSSESNIKSSDEYKAVVSSIEMLRQGLTSIKDRNLKSQKHIEIKKLEKELERNIKSAGESGKIEDWISKGLNSWVDTFMPGAVYCHLYPFDESASFRLKANLKPEFFVDGNAASVDFAYSGRPNVKLTILGLITSVPYKDEHPFDPSEEYQGHVAEDNKNDIIGFESALRNLFRGFETLEKFGKFDRYPHVTIYPLALFRDIK